MIAENGRRIPDSSELDGLNCLHSDAPNSTARAGPAHTLDATVCREGLADVGPMGLR
jgi:hypothetical protein